MLNTLSEEQLKQLKEIQKEFEKQKEEVNKKGLYDKQRLDPFYNRPYPYAPGSCPRCGYCPHCGRGGW